jgi:hypothetical protein
LELTFLQAAAQWAVGLLELLPPYLSQTKDVKGLYVDSVNGNWRSRIKCEQLLAKSIGHRRKENIRGAIG